MTPTDIMPPKPTCKVVKREGQRGARIDPKGCKVRTTKDTQGNKRQYNKRGEEKITLKTTGNEMRLCSIDRYYARPRHDKLDRILAELGIVGLKSKGIPTKLKAIIKWAPLAWSRRIGNTAVTQAGCGLRAER
jgi:hypothetical protein